MSSSSPRGQELSPSPHTPGQERKVPPNLTIYPVSRTTDLPPCLFCKRCENHQEKYGQLITDRDSGITVHYFCLLLSSGIHQEGGEDEGIYGFREQEIIKECKRGQRLKCSFCEQKGATIGCCTKRCRIAFHLPCGMENKTLHLFFDDFKSYCKEHRPMQVISKDMILDTPEKNPVCPICMYRLTPKPSDSVLKTPCCKRTWLHRDCVQRQASNAGMYFFRCPICNTKETFQQEMLKNGIYIPEQDASWELEDNAFEELLQRYNRCDAEKCDCVQGRNFNKEWGKWRIVLCQLCGSSGIHKLCGQLKRARWKCKDCTEMLAKAKEASKERKRKEKEELEKQQKKAANGKKENKVGGKLKVRRSSNSKKGRKLILSGKPMLDERRILGRNCRVVLTPVNAQHTEDQCQLGATLSQTSSDEEISMRITEGHIPTHKAINVRVEGVMGSLSPVEGSGSTRAHTPTKVSTTDKKTKGTIKKSLKRRKVSDCYTASERKQKLKAKRKKREADKDSISTPQSPEIDVYKSRSQATPTSSVKLGLYLSPSSDDDDSIPLARLVTKENLGERSLFAPGQTIHEDYQNVHIVTSKPELSCAVSKGWEETGFITDKEEPLASCDKDAVIGLANETYKGSQGPSQIHTPKRSSQRISDEPSTPDLSVQAPVLTSMLLRSGSSIKSAYSGEEPSKCGEDVDMSDPSPLVGKSKRKGNASEEALVPKVRKQTARKSCQPYRPPCRRNLLEYSGQSERQPSPDTPEELLSAEVNPLTASEGSESSCDSPNEGSTATSVAPSQALQPDLLECQKTEEGPCHPPHQVDGSSSTAMADDDPDVVLTAVCTSPNSSQSSGTASTSDSSSCLACLIAARKRTMGPLFIDLTEDTSSSSSSQQDLNRPSSPSTVTLSSSSDTENELDVEFVAETPQAKNTDRTLPGIPTRRRFGSDSSGDITIKSPTKNNNFLKTQGESCRANFKSTGNDGSSNVSKSGAKSKSLGLKVRKKSGGKVQRSKSIGKIGKVRHKSGNKDNKDKLSTKGRVRKLKQLRIKWPDPFSLQFRSTESSSESKDGDVQDVTMHVKVKTSPKCLSEGQGGQKRKRSSSLTSVRVDVPSFSVKVTTTPSSKRRPFALSCETERDKGMEDEVAVAASGLRMATRQTPLKPAGSTILSQESASPRTPSRLSKRNRVLEY
ncbi:G2E3 [Branchiostoma lanceolatum]|uniref:G2E3 protein n=1 Tax=Branchiostoma lanceolatum TaxID=7740 RepID=A0A8J9ZSH0_BRALA|nr:G2E3 [Branchiostoma lanceolatum]